MIILDYNRKIIVDFYGDRTASVRLFRKNIKIVYGYKTTASAHLSCVRHVITVHFKGIWLHFTIRFNRTACLFLSREP